MAGSGSKGKWEASIVTESAILELKSAGYLPADVAHRAPEAGQVIPMPQQGERVVFVPYFI
jgi:hypothetical protein